MSCVGLTVRAVETLFLKQPTSVCGLESPRATGRNRGRRVGPRVSRPVGTGSQSSPPRPEPQIQTRSVDPQILLNDCVLEGLRRTVFN